jgi:cytochrome c-type biogenesis protein CcsB
MQQYEIILFWATVFVYVAAFCVGLFGFVRGKDNWAKPVIRLFWAGFIVHTATGIVRWVAGGHAPVTGDYELNLTGTWFIVLVYLLFERIGKAEQIISLIVAPATFLVLGNGYMNRTEAGPMGDAFNSPWLAVHVVFAWLGFGCYLISAGAGIMFLLRNRLLIKKPERNIPPLEALDISSYRFIVLGFINHAVMLISGAIWAKKLWGRYWSWDALETWSLLAFLFYAFYLHTRSFLGWKDKRAAWLTIVGIIFMAISFWGVAWFSPSIHPGP